MDSAIALLAELVSINSINPSLVSGAPGETQIADAIAAHLRRIGMDVEMQPAAPNRPGRNRPMRCPSGASRRGNRWSRWT